MMGKSVFFSEGTAGQMKRAPSFAKDDDSTLPKEPNGSKIGLGPKPIWGMPVKQAGGALDGFQRLGWRNRLTLRETSARAAADISAMSPLRGMRKSESDRK